MRISLQKRQNKFIKLINEQASLTLEGLEALKAYMENQDASAADLLREKEKEADEARRILIDELNRTFVTPFDREDIFSLSRAIDDVLDYAYSTSDEMEILKVEPTPYMRRMASLLRDAAYELFMAVEPAGGPSAGGGRARPARQGAREPGGGRVPRGAGGSLQRAAGYPGHHPHAQAA